MKNLFHGRNDHRIYFKTLCLSLCFFLPNIFVHCKEVDSFTNRKEILERQDLHPETINKLDTITQNLLAKAVDEVNQHQHACDPETLFKGVKDKLAGKKVLNVEASYGAMEAIVDHGFDEESKTALKVFPIEKKQSIYKNFGMTKAPFLKTVASLIRIDNYVVGADKFGHFFGQGYTYYQTKKKKNLKAALKFGDHAEKGNMGWGVNGVYSYGDLTANYEGMRFWDRLVDRLDGKEPYVLCQNGKWKVNPDVSFQWSDYISPAWDEGLNCSVYRDQTLTNRVVKEGLALQKKGKGLSLCPVEKQFCHTMNQRYGDLADDLISPECRSHKMQEDKQEVENTSCQQMERQEDSVSLKAPSLGRQWRETRKFFHYFMGYTVQDMFKSFGHGIQKKVLRTGKGIKSLFKKPTYKKEYTINDVSASYQK